MNWKTLFFGFDGRIGRKQWWLATIVSISASLVMSMLVNPLAWFGDGSAPTNAPDMMLSLAFLIPMTAVNIKRGNDRDWPQTVIYGYSLMTLAVLVYDYSFTMFRYPELVPLELVLVSAFLLATLALFIDLGGLRGTRGPNRNGPDPLANPDEESESRALKA